MILRLTPEELKRLDEQVSETNLSREAFVRMVLAGNRLVAKPDLEYAEILRQLHYIGNNIRQLAIKAYYTQNVNSEYFIAYSKELDRVVSGLVKEMSRRTVKD